MGLLNREEGLANARDIGPEAEAQLRELYDFVGGITHPDQVRLDKILELIAKNIELIEGMGVDASDLHGIRDEFIKLFAVTGGVEA